MKELSNGRRISLAYHHVCNCATDESPGDLVVMSQYHTGRLMHNANVMYSIATVLLDTNMTIGVLHVDLTLWHEIWKAVPFVAMLSESKARTQVKLIYFCWRRLRMIYEYINASHCAKTLIEVLKFLLVEMQSGIAMA